jgi:uncharacterized membrane protein YqjE
VDSIPPNSGGWLESLRRVGESLLGLARSRFELFTVEWQEEKLRLLSLLVWLGIAFVLGAAGLLIGVATLALWLWERAGYAGLIGLSVVTLGAAAALVWTARRRIQTGPAPFAHTVAEFRKDGACLRNNK